MTTEVSTFTTTMTIGELEASYPLYCRALRILIQEGKSLNKIKRTVCWSRLTSLHTCLPRRYRDPEHLYFVLRREVEPEGAAGCSPASPSTAG
ncbi:DUF3136 domain-containing protein [Aphanothece microscopica]|uniref:DUF3136 domain-containing protein n=2 Tax=Aphanothece TaxID=1121 RepID=UPI0039855D52